MTDNDSAAQEFAAWAAQHLDGTPAERDHHDPDEAGTHTLRDLENYIRNLNN